MHIRSPKSGSFDVFVRGRTVARGELLFALTGDEEELEVLKAELALSLIVNARARVDQAIGSLQIKAALDRFNTCAEHNLKAHRLLLVSRKEEFALGSIGEVTLQQIVALEKLAVRDLKLAMLSRTTIRSSVVDALEILKDQEKFASLALRICKARLDRLKVTAPKDGILSWWREEAGWVSRGDIVASYAV